MTVVIASDGTDGSLVAPFVMFDVAIGEGDDAAFAVGTIREIEEGVGDHLHAEIRPANAAGMSILEGKRAGRHRGDEVGVFFIDPILRGETGVPGTLPSEIGVHGITAEAGESQVALHEVILVGGTEINAVGLDVVGEEGVVRVEQVGVVGVVGGVEEGALDPELAGGARGIDHAIGGEPIGVVGGVEDQSDRKLFLIVDAADAFCDGFGAGQRGQEQRGKDRNNRDNNQQLNQREPGLAFRPHDSSGNCHEGNPWGRNVQWGEGEK